MERNSFFHCSKRVYTQLGIDYSQHGIAASLLERSPSGWKIINQMYVEKKHHSLKSILKEIQRCFSSRNNFSIILGFSFQKIIIKELFLDPKLNDHEIYYYLQKQALTLFGNAGAQLQIDYEFLETQELQQLRLIRAVAVYQDELEQVLYSCRVLSWKVKAVEVTLLSLARIIPCLVGYSSGKHYGILLFTKQESRFCVFFSGQLYYEQAISENDSVTQGLLNYHNIYSERSLQCLFLIIDPSVNLFPLNLNFHYSWIKDIRPAKLRDHDSDPIFLGSIGLAKREIK